MRAIPLRDAERGSLALDELLSDGMEKLRAGRRRRGQEVSAHGKMTVPRRDLFRTIYTSNAKKIVHLRV